MKGKAKKVRKFAEIKRIYSTTRDARIKGRTQKIEKKSEEQCKSQVRNLPRPSSALFFSHNEMLGPPYHVLVDTNFINFSIKNKIEIVNGMMDCLLAKCIIYITDCVMGEIEKLGIRYRVALRIAQNPKFERLKCTHKGTYADDCIVERVTHHKCYIVATCDGDLKRRIRKIPGVPIMYVAKRKFAVERLPEVRKKLNQIKGSVTNS